MPLSIFHPVIAEWFRSNVGTPTDVQAQTWPAIQSGADTLIAAPTGSGKTFAAFLSCIDHLFQQALARELDDHTQVLYVSPLKALSKDIRKTYNSRWLKSVPQRCDGALVRAILGWEAVDRPNEQIEWSGRANQVSPHYS